MEPFITEEDRRWELITQDDLRWQCSDDPAFREMVLALNDAVSPEARALHREMLIVDACTFNVTRYGWRLEAAGATALGCTVPGVFDSAGDAFRAIAAYYGLPQGDQRFRMIFTPEDIPEAKKAGQTGLIIAAQGCNFVQAFDMEPLLLAFSRLGLRIMQIGYNYRSFAADGCFSPSNAGLSDNGPELIRLMEKYGITVDLSHIGERSALEASELAQKPQIYSHSNPRALFDHPRNISDEQAKKCAATGGVIGVSGYNVTLWDGKRFPNIDSFVDCIAYYCDLLGPEHVGVGMDTTATEGCYPRDEILYFNRLVRQVSGKNAVAYQSFLQGRPAPLGNCVEGLMCLANWVRLVDRMLQRGFSAEEIRQIGGENWLRVFRATWPH